MYIMNFNQATTKIQTLVVRSDGNPVDWTSQIQINEREYDKAYIQLIDVGMNLANTGAFPANETDARVIVNLESNLGQSIYDTNGKQSFLGCFNYSRPASADTSHYYSDSRLDNICQPIIELPRIPNGQFNFKLTDHAGSTMTYISDTAIDGGTQKLQQTILVFQLYLAKSSHIKSQVMI